MSTEAIVDVRIINIFIILPILGGKTINITIFSIAFEKSPWNFFSYEVKILVHAIKELPEEFMGIFLLEIDE